ncbi:MAG: NAD(P)-dependent oxidoreductase [Deltaproteobacteria bacterium]|nr:NAD(P)-dependent oxidoreductase [Deltaproteobacteria bacterium]
MAAREFPFQQLIVIGGTGQTGHRVLELAVEFSNARLVATSRKATVDSGCALPDGPLAATVMQDAKKWGAKVKWCALDLEADTPALLRALELLAANLMTGKRTALVFASAFTNVEACEADARFCERVNERNTAAVLKWARDRFGATLVFFSSDYVFDGVAGPYVENAPRAPLSVYGRSKAFIEEWLENNAPASLIIRTTGVYDYLPGSKNFLMQMLAAWGQGKPTPVPNDQLANPVWAHDLARATLELLGRSCRGVYNVAGATRLVRADFAGMIAKVFGLDSALVQPIETKALGQKALRPLDGGLVCDKLKSELGWAPAGAAEVLESLKWLYTR